MSLFKAGSKKQPFPLQRPDIAITPSRAKPFAVDFREVPWWFGVPEVGDRTLWTIYDPPDWHLDSVTEMVAVRPASIHGVEGVEFEVNEWEPVTGWTLGKWTMFARLTEKTVQWLATLRLVDGKRRLYTFQDEGFGDDWGEMPRKLEDRGRYALQPDGSLKQRPSRRHRAPGAIGAGMFRVRVGRRAFTCLRVFQVQDGQSAFERGILVEAYLTRSGRTVLFRRYNGRLWQIHRGSTCGGPPWDERLPEHARIVIDGATFVHWYDCLSGLACGTGP